MNERSDKNQKIFTNEEIKNFSALYDSLLQVHNRLINDGYIIQNNHISPPDNTNQLSEKQTM